LAKKVKMTNRKYALDNKEFNDLCQKFDVKPTARQASKYRNKKGALYKKSKGLM